MIFAQGNQGPKSDAGPDKLIFLTQGNSVELGGSSSGTSFLWTKIYDVQPRMAGYPIDPSAIVSPTSAQTLIKGLVQGVWYYQLAVLAGGAIKYDTVVVRVDYDIPPLGATIIDSISTYTDLNNLATMVNLRIDTATYFPLRRPESRAYNGSYRYYLYRNSTKLTLIDSSRGKLYTTIEDNVPLADGFNRIELQAISPAPDGKGGIDTNHIYIFEWKGYFTQNPSKFFTNDLHDVDVILSFHGNSKRANPFNILISYPNLVGAQDAELVGDTGALITTRYPHFYRTDSMVNRTHTFRVWYKMGKGYPGQTAFLKVQIDGNTVYIRTEGPVGDSYSGFSTNYNKFATLCDFGNEITNPSNLSRGRSFSLVTEAYRLYAFNTKAEKASILFKKNKKRSRNSMFLIFGIVSLGGFLFYVFYLNNKREQRM
jgi:hypothetical protein